MVKFEPAFMAAPMLLTLLGITTFFRFGQPKNAKSPIATTESGTVIDSTLLIFEKQLLSISFTG